jgi:hypothetical protein
LRSGALLIKVTPLAEEVIRLAAPDTYERLHALVESRRPEAGLAAGFAEPQFFLLSFFSHEPDTPFQPEALQLVQQGRVHHPLAINPLTPGWGAGRLPRQATQSAIYLFAPTLDLRVPFTVGYDLRASEDWSRIIPLLQFERGRVGGHGGQRP